MSCVRRLSQRTGERDLNITGDTQEIDHFPGRTETGYYKIYKLIYRLQRYPELTLPIDQYKFV